ncbi:helix-turn-helix transcriptional regulator [Paenibacillus melissococcoides]|uniref:Helix-turn-helix transcriptional regulator n=1 Tax=Paenibacillus melissococcoides TaxID=2912268 RepID=A0ABN8UEC3_9BACL|nr:helix-turn-helix transcriptional regulator [Paenibacillus melissococcoides]CAH8248480.1 helix-turn-helix transcriptional regulator [Paenibacillus melissococcoides]CAH8722096.1 helix-turn-helix transcriptional regulator [Paenibacillus melissococcoides]CAH8722125.1 helix-turn-helix transcriptional regulator [Paenibacillus melissococcoides]
MIMAISFKPLWRLLVDKELKKEYLHTELKIARSVLAKMGKNEYVSMEILDRICTHFKVQPFEVIEHIDRIIPEIDET